MQTNAHGQPVGDPVLDWQPRPRPDAAVLTGSCCRLERLDEARHAADLFAADRADAAGTSWTYLPYGPFGDLETYAAWVRGVTAQDDPYFFAVVDTAPGSPTYGRAVGVLSLLRITPAAGTIEVGHIHLSPALQQTRASTEAQFLLMRHVFDDLGYRRYEWKCDALNAPSRRAAERLGFSYEGTFRQAVVVKGRNRDTAWFAVIDADWPRIRAAYAAWLAPDNFDGDGRQRSSLRVAVQNRARGRPLGPPPRAQEHTGARVVSAGYDVIVIGVGSMGSAAANTLAARGLRVLGLENFGPAHDQGSAHGGSRIIRQSYFEGPAYVPLLQRAFAGWSELQEESGRDLLRLCGGIYLGDPDNPVVTGSREAARVHGLPHEVLDAAEIRRRFPTMDPADHAVGVYEPNAGYVRPEETVLAGIDLARRRGAVLHFEEPATGWRATPGGGVEVTTAQATYGADRLVLTPGAWTPRLLPGAATILVERQVFYWFEPDLTARVPYERYTDGHPVYIEETDGNGMIYGFPMMDGPAGGLKLAFYRQNIGLTTPDTVDRTVHAEEVDAIRRRAVQLFPRLTGPLLKAATCLYASAPDDHFVIGPLEQTPQVVVACGFSGHGFKFVPVIGEIVADLVQTGRTAHDIDLFDLGRPAFSGSRP